MACSRRASLPNASHAHRTGGSPSRAMPSSRNRRVRASIVTAITCPTSTGSTLVSTSAATTSGRSRPARRPRVVRRALDRALEGERGLPGEAEQVGVGDHADHGAGAVGHGEMVDPSFEHPEEHVPDPGLSRHRHDRGRHDLRDEGVGAASGGQDPRAQIAVGHDPPVIADLDEERGHPLFGHQGRDLGDRRVGRRGDGWTAHLRPHRGEHVRHLGRGSLGVQASTRDRREERVPPALWSSSSARLRGIK
jgi:hypothetical protein